MQLTALMMTRGVSFEIRIAQKESFSLNLTQTLLECIDIFLETKNTGPMESLRLVCLSEATLTDEEQAELRCEIDGDLSLDGTYEGNKITCCGTEVGWEKCLKRLSSKSNDSRIQSNFHFYSNKYSVPRIPGIATQNYRY